MENKRIAVVGVGGVGGYLAGMMLGAFSGLTVVARNARGEAIRRDGLILHSEYKGERSGRPSAVVGSAAKLAHQDYIFICVKNYSLEEVCRELEGVVTEDTVLIPVMNGVDAAERVRRLLPRGIVVDSLIYIVSFARADHSIEQQGQFADVRIGSRRADERHRRAVADVSEILTRADVDHEVAEDIECEIWKKYILNCAYNVATAYYDCPIGPLRKDPVKAGEYETLIREAYAVARAKGVAVPESHTGSCIRKFYEDYGDEATSSLQRDIHEGRQSEVETFSGYLVREAGKLGVRVPVSERMYEGLKRHMAPGDAAAL